MPMLQEVELLGAKPGALRSKGERISRSLPLPLCRKVTFAERCEHAGPTNSQSASRGNALTFITTFILKDSSASFNHVFPSN